MIKALVVMLSCILLSACAKDSLEIRNDFSVESHMAGDLDIEVTFKGSNWNTYDKDGINVNEWVGPYRLLVYSNIPAGTQPALNITAIEIAYTDGETVLNIPKATLEKTKSSDKKQERYFFHHRLVENLKFQSISVSLSYAYKQGSSVISERVSFIVEPKKSERPYNSFWAGLMSV